MGPGVFMGIIALRMLQQVVHAFEKVHTSLLLFLHNWTIITEFRSIGLRLREFEEHLENQQNMESKSGLKNVNPFPAGTAREKNVTQSWNIWKGSSPISVRVTLRRFNKLFQSGNEGTGL